MKRYFIFLFTMMLMAQQAIAGDFVTVRGTRFYTPDNDKKPYYFIGTNIWYTPILASTGQGGNRDRLKQELDELQRLGIDNLRILVGADAGSDSANTVRPYLQPEPGVLNDTLLDGLDYLLKELEERKMYGVFYLNNSWDWSGGYGFYLKNTGHGDSPNAAGEGYNNYVAYAAAFAHDEKAQELYLDFVRKIVSRTNRYTKKPYKESPAIMSWQLCNEPRAFSKSALEGYERWLIKAAKLIKSIDPNHLVSTGSEGIYGCERSMDTFERIHSAPEIDYLTIHIWPVNWGWASRASLYTSLPNVYVRAGEYIKIHERAAIRCNKPLVIEEFGYSRERNSYHPATATTSRDAFYNFIFSQLLANKAEGGPIVGANFWGWGGKGRPDGETWKAGNDYLCDPPHEPQGWYSVFDTDTSTLKCIKDYIQLLKK